MATSRRLASRWTADHDRIRLEGAIARHVTGRPRASLSLAGLLERIAAEDRRTAAAMLGPGEAAGPTLLRVEGAGGQLASFRFSRTAAGAGERPRGGATLTPRRDARGLSQDARALAPDLAQALARGELELRYQPVIDARNRRVEAVEVLLRWRHPRLGLVPPDRFVPVAESLGLIGVMTDWIVEQARAELGPLLERHALGINVNLSACQIGPGLVHGLIPRLLGLKAAQITVELTESVLLEDAPEVEAALADLCAAGIKIALDDFGTGYSSLAYLERYPVGALKIDRRFVRKLQHSSGGRALLDAILSMAAALDLETVAEGVETVEQLAYLVSRGCRSIQGFVFAPPLHVGELASFLERFRFPEMALARALRPSGPGLPPLLAADQEQVLRLFVRHAPMAVAMFDTGMRYLLASDRWLDDYGIADREVVGLCHYDALPDTPPRWRDIHARGLAGQHERCEEDTYLRPDGKREWLRWEVLPFRDRFGDVAGIIIFSEFITARKEAEHELARGAEQLRLAEQLAGVGSWAEDQAGRLQFSSAGLCAIAGHDPLAEPALRAILHPDDREPWQAAWDRARAAGEPFSATARILRPDGELRQVAARALPQLDAMGELTGYFGVLNDVSREAAAHEALAAQLRETAVFQAVFEALPDQVYYKDRDCRFVVANAATARLVGIEGPERLLGRTDLELLGPELGRRLHDDEQRVLAGGEPVYLEQAVRRADGEQAWLGVLKVPVRDASGEVTGLVGHERDITELVRAREEAEARRGQSELYRQAIEALPDFVFCKDLDGRFLVANRATATFMGVSDPAVLVGRTDFEFFPPELAARYREDELNVLAGGVASLIEQPLVRPDGSAGTLCSLKVPLRDAEGRIVAYAGHGRDITAQRATEAEARRLEAEADRAREMLANAVEVLADGLAVFDPQDRLSLCNAEFACVYGAEPDMLIGRSFSDILFSPALLTALAIEPGALPSWLAWRLERHQDADSTAYEVELGGRWFLTRERRMRDGSVLLTRTDVTALKRVEANLRRLATTDMLTEVWNRRHFVEQGSRLLLRAIRTGSPVTVILFDIDRFKQVNDRYGHAGGDEALRQMSRLCAELLRPEDLLARWGGEEFILLLPRTGLAGGVEVAERLRTAVAGLTIHAGGQRFSVTASFGVALASGPDLDELTRRADDALYQAKELGRNRVECHDPRRPVPA